MLSKIANVHYKYHLLAAFLLRILLILYGNYQDQVSNVSYTDVDYRVFTDAARHIYNNYSPYDRHTYRYSPTLAILMIPNVILHKNFGKFLFSFCDLIVALLIRTIVKNAITDYERFKKSAQQHEEKAIKAKKSKANLKSNFDRPNFAMYVWLYNPLTIAIATRGSCDSISALFVLLTLFLLQVRKSYFSAGLVHGLSVHFRLYPIAYSLAYFMYLSKFSHYSLDKRESIENTTNENNREIAQNSKHVSKKRQQSKQHEQSVCTKRNKNADVAVLNDKSVIGSRQRKTIFKKHYLLYFVPNFDQWKLILGTLISLSFLTYIFYYYYGYKFLFESYIYHLIRKDTRHNFSLYFYLQYLTAGVKNIGLWQKLLIMLPQIILLILFAVRYGLNKFSLNFAILTQTVVIVAYNSVLTSQYFVWVWAVLPLCLWQIKMRKRTSFFLLLIWFMAQGAWLLPAYFLEFHGQNTFLFVWGQSVSFFCANVAILGRIIMNFIPARIK